MSKNRVRIGSLEIDSISWEGALEKVGELINSRRGGYALTPNVDHIVLAQQDEDFRRLYLGADLVVADGQPLIWASRLLGTPLPEKISGSDFISRFAPLAMEREYKIFLLGGRPGAARQTAQLFGDKYPGIRIVGTSCPPLGFELSPESNREVIKAINAVSPDIVFIALGTPKQEKWIARYRREYAPAISFPVGAGFDFLSGQVRRAPAWMRRVGLEWFWRLCQEPRRLAGRYLARDFRFVPIVFKQMRGA